MESAAGILRGHLRPVIGTAAAALAAGVLIAAGPATAAAPVAHAAAAAHAASSPARHHRRHRKHHRRHHRRHLKNHTATHARSASVNTTTGNTTPQPLVPLPPCANTDTPATQASAADMRLAVECLVNQQRTDHGLPALADDSKLTASAQNWSDHMVATGAFTHGTDFAGRISSVGYDWQQAGENIATGYETPNDVVTAWMASPEHCQNILDPSYASFGTGLNTSPVGSYATGPSTWTQDFGLTMSQTEPSHNQAPMNACPYGGN